MTDKLTEARPSEDWLNEVEARVRSWSSFRLNGETDEQFDRHDYGPVRRSTMLRLIAAARQRKARGSK